MLTTGPGTPGYEFPLSPGKPCIYYVILALFRAKKEPKSHITCIPSNPLTPGLPESPKNGLGFEKSQNLTGNAW